MKRRGFLGFLGAAAVAGPGMAKAAAAQGMEAMSIGPTLSSMGIAINAPFGGDSIKGLQDEYDPIAWAKRDLARFFGKSAERLLTERLQTNVAYLDPDIAGMRSLSLTTKVRMQRDRNFERAQAGERDWLKMRLHDALNPATTD